MTNRYPLIIDTADGNKIKELPADDNLYLRNNSITDVQDITALGTINAADIRIAGIRLVAQTFTDLTDTPNNYTSAASSFVKVNSAGTALEFAALSSLGSTTVNNLTVDSGDIFPLVNLTNKVGKSDKRFAEMHAGSFYGDLKGLDGTIVFNATTNRIPYAAIFGAPTALSEFINDIGSGGVDLTAFSVGADNPASDSGALDYDNTTGVFTYTPPDLTTFGAITADSIVADSLEFTGLGVVTLESGSNLVLNAANGAGNIVASNSRITNVGAPIASEDAATKAYVDAGDSSDRLVNGVNEVVLGATGVLTLPNSGTINDYVGSAGVLGIFIDRTFQTPDNTNSANFGTDTVKLLLSDVEAAEIVSYLTASIGVRVWFNQGNNYPITSCVQVSTGIWTVTATGMGNTFATFAASNTLIFIYTGATPNTYTNFPQYVPVGDGAGITISKGGNSWNFGTDGSLTLPQGSYIDETAAPLGTAKSLDLHPGNPGYPNQYLKIYPTVSADADHLHLTSGDLTATELFLGDDEQYVKLTNNGNVEIRTGAFDYYNSTKGVWTFDSDGALTLPTRNNTPGSRIKSAVDITIETGPYYLVDLVTVGGGSVVGGIGTLDFLISSAPDWATKVAVGDHVVSGTWTDIIIAVGPAGDVNRWTVTFASGEFTGNDNKWSFYKPGAGGEWQFGADGNLTFPDSTTQTTAYTGGGSTSYTPDDTDNWNEPTVNTIQAALDELAARVTALQNYEIDGGNAYTPPEGETIIDGYGA